MVSKPTPPGEAGRTVGPRVGGRTSFQVLTSGAGWWALPCAGDFSVFSRSRPVDAVALMSLEATTLLTASISGGSASG